MKEKVYIETSVISYFTARPSRDIIQTAYQEITRSWWEKIFPKYDNYVSVYVIEEISKGDKVASSLRLEAIKGIPIYETNPDTEKLAAEFIQNMKIPLHAQLDCYHLATAVVNGVDFIVSWNFKHIANPHIRLIYREINNAHGLITPEICTPEEMLGEE